jgi:hypothetical protein
VADDPNVETLLGKRLIFVTGKGGVGKTTVALALGLLAAKRGKKVLLCEAEPKGEFAQYFSRPRVGFVPTEVRPNLWCMEMDTEAALYEYLRIYLKVGIPRGLGPLAKTFDFVANAAPGVKEILVIGKLCYEVRAGHFDLIVVDAAAAGQILSQLQATRGVGALIPVGMVRDQTEWMSALLADPAITAAFLVTTAEETPVEEAIELGTAIRRETDVTLAMGFINKVIPSVFSPSEANVAMSLLGREERARLLGLLGDDAERVLRAVELWNALTENHARNESTLRDAFGGTLPMVQIPLIAGPNAGDGIVEEVTETIEVALS